MPPDQTLLDPRLEALLSMPHVVVVVLDHEGRVRHLNGAAGRLACCPIEALRGLPFRALIHPGHHADADRWIDGLRETGEQPGPLEVRAAVPGGDERWVAWSGAVDRHHGELLVFGMDVTGRRMGECEAEAMSQRLGEAQRIARIGSWTWDVSSHRTRWSEEMYSLFGLDPSLPAPRYEQDPSLYTEESRARLRLAATEAVAHGVPYELELERRLPGGEMRAYVARGEPERGADGTVIRLSGTVQDVTALRAAERARHQTEQRLHHLAAQVPGCIYEYRVYPDGTSRFVYMSEGVRDLFGIAPEAACADVAAVHAVILPDDRGPMQRSIEQSVASMTEWRHEFRVRRPDGELRVIRGQSRPRRLPDGTVVKSGQLTDVTDVRRVARLLDETQRTASVGGWEADLTTGRLYWTDEMFRLFGVSGPEPPTLSAALELLGSAHASRARARLAAAEDIDEEIEVAGADGHGRWLRFKGRSERAGGRVVRMYGSAQDITALKMSETESKRKEQELVAAREAALEASRAKSRFLANMSHEIRTPMNGVLGMAALALESCETDDQREYLQVIYDSGHHLLGILNDVLDLAKVEARKLDIERRPFDLNALVAEVARPFTAQARSLGLRFDVRVSGAASTVAGDSLRVAQVLRNLLSNAFKFTVSGGVTLAVSADQDGRTHLDVADTGTGIPADRAARLFEPFTQGDDSTARRHGGTGLGLAISRELVGLMGGTIAVESEIGRGSTFRVVLPLPSAGAEPAGRRDGGGRGRWPRLDLRVLLAEDNPVNARVATLVLTRLGCQTTAAASGHAALDVLAGGSFDVALIDLDMPGLGGLDVARRIRLAEAGNGRLPLVALTADAMKGTEARCLEAGMDGYLTKPIDLRVLADTLSRLVTTQAH